MHSDPTCFFFPDLPFSVAAAPFPSAAAAAVLVVVLPLSCMWENDGIEITLPRQTFVTPKQCYVIAKWLYEYIGKSPEDIHLENEWKHAANEQLTFPSFQ